MGKLLILLITPVAIGVSTLLFGASQDSLGSADTTVRRRAHDAIAREIAYSGLADAESSLMPALMTSPNYTGTRNFSRSFGNGSYTSTITTLGATHTISSTGTINGHTADTRRVYRAEFVPSFMGPAGLIHGNLQMTNNFTVTSEDPTRNADVRTNGNLEFHGGTSSIQGFGLRVGNATFSNGQTAAQVFRPNSNPSGGPVTQAVAPIVIPPFQAEAHQARANRTTNGTLDLTGNVVLGTRTNPVIWFVNGNLRTTGNVTLSGYGIFLVKGTVEVYHHVRSSPTSESVAAFYTNGDIQVKAGSLDMTGQWLTNGNIQTMAGTRLIGSFTTRGNLQTNGGSLTVIHRPSSSALTEPIWPQISGSTVLSTAVPRGLTQLSHREW